MRQMTKTTTTTATTSRTNNSTKKNHDEKNNRNNSDELVSNAVAATAAAAKGEGEGEGEEESAPKNSSSPQSTSSRQRRRRAFSLSKRLAWRSKSDPSSTTTTTTTSMSVSSREGDESRHHRRRHHHRRRSQQGKRNWSLSTSRRRRQAQQQQQQQPYGQRRILSAMQPKRNDSSDVENDNDYDDDDSSSQSSSSDDDKRESQSATRVGGGGEGEAADDAKAGACLSSRSAAAATAAEDECEYDLEDGGFDEHGDWSTSIILHSSVHRRSSEERSSDRNNCNANGNRKGNGNGNNNNNIYRESLNLPDDPTVQESFECVFSHQLASPDFWHHDDETDDEDDYNDYDDEYNDDDDNDYEYDQSNRVKKTGRRGGRRRGQHGKSRSSSAPPHKASLTHLGTMRNNYQLHQLVDIRFEHEWVQSSKREANAASAAADDERKNKQQQQYQRCYSCQLGRQAPRLPPQHWPQGPLMLRPTPGSQTRVRGIRRANSTEYLWSSTTTSSSSSSANGGDSFSAVWPNATLPPSHDACAECVMCPVNNGNEGPGHATIIDFESPFFIGSLLVRIRHAKSRESPQKPYRDDSGYFTGMNRRYQVAIQGRFKRPNIAMVECVTGQSLSRPCGKLPPKWIMRGAIKVISFFAPQLQTNFEGPQPTSLSPLGSTPQAIICHTTNHNNNTNKNNNTNNNNNNNNNNKNENWTQADESLEEVLVEPTNPDQLLLNNNNNNGLSSSSSHSSQQQQQQQLPSNPLARAKLRKRAFDKLYQQHQHQHQHQQEEGGSGNNNNNNNNNKKLLEFDTNTIYTFEFLQHLIDFESFSIDLGTMLGHVKLGEMLDGQALQIMAAKQRQRHLHSQRHSLKKKHTTIHNNNSSSSGGKHQHASAAAPILEHLWSFDLWHECLYERAVHHDNHL